MVACFDLVVDPSMKTGKKEKGTERRRGRFKATRGPLRFWMAHLTFFFGICSASRKFSSFVFLMIENMISVK
jgi:hypothetical protein